MRPTATVQEVHALLLTGGSAFGLDAAAGVMAYLRERGIGFDVGVARVPIVPAAALFDLSIGGAEAHPDAAAGRAACTAATPTELREGTVGAGYGACVGRLLGPTGYTKGGLGLAGWALDGSVHVGALAVVNAVGWFLLTLAVGYPDRPLPTRLTRAAVSEIAFSERVVAAFAGNPSVVVKMDGMMLDKPHLRAAEKILAQRRR